MKISHNNITFDISGDVNITIEFLAKPFVVNISVPIIGRKFDEAEDEHVLLFEDVSTSDLEDLRGNILKAIEKNTPNSRMTFTVNTAVFARWLLWYVHLKTW